MIPDKLGHYRIIEKLGEGGWGTVYRAHDERLDRDVALKVLSSTALADEADRKRFRMEALTLAKLNHPNIGQIHDFDTQAGLDFLVMEYVRGGTLSRQIAECVFSEKEVAGVGSQIASALEEAHENGVIHRDLKPANIAITAKAQVKVLDFGLAKLLDASHGAVKADTLTQSVDDPHLVGTLPYMAPEQVTGDRMDGRTDIYGLGVVLYEMATRRRPFREDSLPGLFDSILRGPVVPPRALNPRISPEMERIILKCLEKDPAQRYQSAKEVTVDLRRILAPPSVSSAVNSAASSASDAHTVKWRRQAWMAGGAALVLVIIIALAASIGGIRKGTDAQGAARIHSLAVLPLENFSHDPAQEYFSDGMTEALITELAQIGSVKVVSRTSVMRYKKTDKSLPEIARELNADAIIEGSVLRSGNRVRIVAQLIQARTDQHLWAQTYERDMDDVLKLQSEVAQAVAQQVRIQVTPEQEARFRSRPVVNPRAYEAYLEGHFYQLMGTDLGIRKAIDYYEDAIREDPSFALAYAGLSDAYLDLGAYRRLAPQDAYQRGNQAINKALQLDNQLGEAHTTLGYLEWQFGWDWNAAEREMRRGVDLNPNYVEGHETLVWFLAWSGRYDEAVKEVEEIRRLDPTYPHILLERLGVFYHHRDYKSLLEASQTCVAADPTQWSSHYYLAVSYEGLGRYTEAITEYRQAIELSQGDMDALAGLAHAYVAIGKRAEAQKILGELQLKSRSSYVSPYMIAIIYAAMGQRDKAFDFLEKAYREKSPDLVYFLKADLRIDPLRSDPRFRDLVRRVGLPG